MSKSTLVFPKWKSLLATSLKVHASVPEAKFFQVASIAATEKTNELTVNNRTLVFRGFGSNNSLLAITDLRTDKYKQWKLRSQSEICWYFTETREQYRISNSVTLVGQECDDDGSTNCSMRELLWGKLTENAKAQFFWPTPKQSIGKNGSQIAVNKNNIPDTFVVIIFVPNAVDYLNVMANPQIRELHSFSNTTRDWTYERVHP